MNQDQEGDFRTGTCLQKKIFGLGNTFSIPKVERLILSTAVVRSAKKIKLWEYGQLAGPVTTRDDRSPEKHEKPGKLPRIVQELRRED